MYLTGEAGTGKTYVLNQYIAWLQEHEIEHAVCASTGIAATHVQGITIHSWSGLGVKERLGEYDLERMEQKRPVWNRLNDAQVLIIDEISMLSGEFFDMLDRVLRHIRRNDAPFGGVQVVCCGDFFQLPPVARAGSSYTYAFESAAWKNMNPLVCYLTEQFRQGGSEFLELLSAIRKGRVTESMRQMLEARNAQEFSRSKTLLRLYTHNVDVDRLNEEHLGQLKAPEKTFVMQKAGKAQHVESLMRGCLAPGKLALKKGAEVMFVKNDHGGQYVNGTQGAVVGFETKGPVVKTRQGRTVVAESVSWKREEDDKVLAEIRQVPLRLAWAITVHKSQGMSLDEAEMDLSACFVPGQGYVALSRVREISGLYLRGFNDMALVVDNRIVTADSVLQKRSELAKQRLDTLSMSDVRARHENFIRKSGGVVEPSVHPKKARIRQKQNTLSQTKELLERGIKLQTIARTRGVTIDTIAGHAEKLLEQGILFDFSYLAPNKKLLTVLDEAAAKHGFAKLAPVKYFLQRRGHDISYERLRLLRLYLLSKNAKERN